MASEAYHARSRSETSVVPRTTEVLGTASRADSEDICAVDYLITMFAVQLLHFPCKEQ